MSNGRRLPFLRVSAAGFTTYQGRPSMKHEAYFCGTARQFPVWLLLLASLSGTGLTLLPSLAQAANPPPAKEQPKPAPGASHANFIVAELDSLSESAEDIFTLALGGKMERVGKKLDTLKKNAAAFAYVQDEASSILLPRLGRTIADLERALATKNRLDTMRFSNRITLIAATVAVPFRPSVPTEVSLLDYNGRELEIWSEVKKMDKLSGIVIRMHLAWQTLMPKLIEQNRIKELRRFSDLMGHLELARAPEDYSRLSRQVLAETDVLKAIFLKSAK
jgi:hypothetical protein